VYLSGRYGVSRQCVTSRSVADGVYGFSNLWAHAIACSIARRMHVWQYSGLVIFIGPLPSEGGVVVARR
jgi:hypothetical protein